MVRLGYNVDDFSLFANNVKDVVLNSNVTSPPVLTTVESQLFSESLCYQFLLFANS